MMAYRAEDFPLYLLSLALCGLLVAPALPHLFERLLLGGALVYMGVFFALRHGAKFERNTLREAVQGIVRYPGLQLRNWIIALHAIVPVTITYGLAVAIERSLRPSLTGTKWLAPFPWQWVVWGAFLVITAFRFSVFIAHLLRADVVREVLEASPQKRSIRKLPMHQHVLQAFLTGMLAHLCLVAPAVLFLRWTNPTNLRELLLFTGFALWWAIARPLRKRKIIRKPIAIHHDLVYVNHTLAHQSPFYFAVFHGHHHDAIPSAMIGSAGGTGLFENVERVVTWVEPLESVVVLQLCWFYSIVFDMLVHQYIPGVFPFAKITVLGAAHHVMHHYGSALPIGLIFNGYIETRDLDNGYKPDNAVTRWFLSEVERREGVDVEKGRKFLSLNDYGVEKTPAVAAVEPEPALIAS